MTVSSELNPNIQTVKDLSVAKAWIQLCKALTRGYVWSEWRDFYESNYLKEGEKTD